VPIYNWQLLLRTVCTSC